jgi:hypothetical protein
MQTEQLQMLLHLIRWIIHGAIKVEPGRMLIPKRRLLGMPNTYPLTNGMKMVEV